MPPTLYLIDGHALAYRTFFALTSGDIDQLEDKLIQKDSVQIL